MNPKDMTMEQLKSAAYDQIAILEQTQANLRILNAEIQKRSQSEPTPPITEVKG